MITFLFCVLGAALLIQTCIILIYNKPRFEIVLTNGEHYDTYTVYLNYIKYIDHIYYEEKEQRSKKLFTIKKIHK